MRGDEERAAGSFVRAARLHTDEAIFDKVRAADAVTRGDFVERIEKIDGSEFGAVDGDGRAGFETDFDFFGFFGSFFGRDSPLPHGFARRIGGIFEFAAFVAEMPDVAVATVDIFFALLDGHVVFFGVSDGVFAGVDVPFAPGRDDLHVGRDGFVGEFEANLIVAFAGATVREAVRAELERDFRLALGDDGTRHGSAEKIRVFVDGAGAERGPDEIADEFFAKIFDGGGRGAGGERFFVRGLQVFLLADVADHGDDF